MSTSPNARNPAAEGQHGVAEAAKHVTDAIQQGMSAMMAVPHKLMQANLEAATHAVNVMNRRMKTQAALWNGIGNFSDMSGAADAQRTYLEAVTRDCAEELTDFTAMAKKNFAAMSQIAASAGAPGFMPSKSS
jgi:hypothetical protein